MMESVPIPIFTFSPNQNNYYTSINDTTILLLNNAQIGLVLCLQITSLLLIGNLLLFAPIFRRVSVKISAMLKLYLSFHALLLFLHFGTYLQKAFALFDPLTNFNVVIWIYIISGPYLFIQPYLSLILTVERTLIIQFPISFMHYRKHYIRAAAFLTPLVYFLAIIWDILEIPLDPAICTTFNLAIANISFYSTDYVKIDPWRIGYFCQCLFLYMLKQADEKQIKNRVVKFTVICEILMEILPAFIIQIRNFANVTPAMWNNYVNPISTVMATMNLTLCVLYYNWIFLIVGPRRIGGAGAAPGQVQ